MGGKPWGKLRHCKCIDSIEHRHEWNWGITPNCIIGFWGHQYSVVAAKSYDFPTAQIIDFIKSNWPELPDRNCPSSEIPTIRIPTLRKT